MFSVGIDDFSEFDERPKTLAHKRGYLGSSRLTSNAVFEFSAKSARLIAQKHPSKLVGCIAYLACENPPSFMLPGNLVPYFTTDRANYFDAKYKELDFKTLDAWGKSAKFFLAYTTTPTARHIPFRGKSALQLPKELRGHTRRAQGHITRN